MITLVPRVGANGLIYCQTHWDEVAAALQTATVKNHPGTHWTETDTLGDPTLFLTILESHAIFKRKLKSYYDGNASMGMCKDCAHNFWRHFNHPPLFINQYIRTFDDIPLAETNVNTSGLSHPLPLFKYIDDMKRKTIITVHCPECMVIHSLPERPFKTTVTIWE